jgi:hypothetical protein
VKLKPCVDRGRHDDGSSDDGSSDDGSSDDGSSDDGSSDDGSSDDGSSDDGSSDDGCRDDGCRDDGCRDDGCRDDGRSSGADGRDRSRSLEAVEVGNVDGSLQAAREHLESSAEVGVDVGSGVARGAHLFVVTDGASRCNRGDVDATIEPALRCANPV